MKKLLIVRHAKASLGGAEQRDIERPLTKSGQHAAESLATLLKTQEIFADHLVSSPALRTLSTAKHLASVLQYPENLITVQPELYDAELSSLVKTIQQFDSKWKTVWLVGHNPSLTELCVFLSEDFTAELPTCGAVYFELPILEWKDLDQGQGSILSQFNL